ncbi:hypothetical protein BDY21DRAFT_356286 [Lineolata rhizophorae]|uniref:RNA helicase HEL117 n=1 Tax=Lineolata rhizophorae TaxID=578093 RepID=A0A6A6NPJ5_9PEZI|nr:hypothetical protein BDY21DRAFT_356286 [Lineolata rhizophorae]
MSDHTHPSRRAFIRPRSLSRSRSPRRGSDHHDSHRRRSYHRDHNRSSAQKPRRSSPPPSRRFEPASLPCDAPVLSRKHDLERFRPVFALYLDIQKQLYIEELSERELKGRWKSFAEKWNRGELAEGWYDPATWVKAKEMIQSDIENDQHDATAHAGPSRGSLKRNKGGDQDDESSDEDEFGPAPLESRADSRRYGAAVPNMEELQERNELALQDKLAERDDLRYERKLDRKKQKERLEELAPRADPGTRERQLEKKREATETMRSYREAKSPGAEEVGERDLMGDDGVESYRASKKVEERKKNEREIRREEIMRARAELRQQKLAAHKEKEERTMEFLKELAKQRFG